MPSRLRLRPSLPTSFGEPRRSARKSDGAKAGVPPCGAFPRRPSLRRSLPGSPRVPGGQTKRAMTLVDLLNMPRVAVDPRKSRATAGVSRSRCARPTGPATGAFLQIWQIRWRQHRPSQVTSIERAPSPLWSPDDSSWRSRGGAIFLLAGEAGAPRQLSHHATGVFQTWPGSLDGTRHLFSGERSSNRRTTGAQRLRGDVGAGRIHTATFVEGGVADGKEERLTSGDYSITGLSTSGQRQPGVEPRAEPDRSGRLHEGSLERNRTAAPGVQLTHNAVEETDAALSPDGSQVLFVARANDRQEPYYNANLFLMPAAGGRCTR